MLTAGTEIILTHQENLRQTSVIALLVQQSPWWLQISYVFCYQHDMTPCS